MNAMRNTVLGIRTALALTAAAVLPTAGASAQQLCLIHDDAIAELAKRYGERVTARGLAREGKAMVEVFSSDAGTWTLVVTDVNGRSCVVASGEAWATVKAPLGQAS